MENNAFHYVFNKLTGLFENMSAAGENILDRPMELNIWRAPTDNDRKIKLEWMDAHYEQSYVRAYETSYQAEEQSNYLHPYCSCCSYCAEGSRYPCCVGSNFRWRCFCKNEYGKRYGIPHASKVRLRLFLKDNFKNVTYYGIGPDESYVDKCRSGSHGVYTSKVEDLHEDYLRPQENGSHTDCDYVCVSNDKNDVVSCWKKNDCI